MHTLTKDYPLSPAFAASHKFQYAVFIFICLVILKFLLCHLRLNCRLKYVKPHIIFCFICLLFILFPHIVYFPVFLVLLIFSYIPLWLDQILCDLNRPEFITTSSGPMCGLSRQMFHVPLGIYIVLLLGGMFHICLSGPIGLQCCSSTNSISLLIFYLVVLAVIDEVSLQGLFFGQVCQNFLYSLGALSSSKQVFITLVPSW